MLSGAPARRSTATGSAWIRRELPNGYHAAGHPLSTRGSSDEQLTWSAWPRFFEDWKGGDNMETETESAPTPEEGEPTQSEESEGTEESGEETGGEG